MMSAAKNGGNRVSLLVLLAACCGVAVAHAQDAIMTASATGWIHMKTVEDVCKAYPQRIAELLASIDFKNPGLGQAAQALESQNIAQAATALLEYYRTGHSGQWLRIGAFDFRQGRDAVADAILKDTFTFYGATYTVPRLESGHLNWQYRGPENDHEWALALNRHAHINHLLNAYKRTGEPGYVRHLDENLQDFFLASMPYPGRKAARAETATWRSLEIQARAKVWAAVFYGLQNVEGFSDATRLMMLSTLPEHAHYLRHFHAAEGNFVTMEMSGLAMIAAAWPEFKASREWMDYARRTIGESMRESVYPDGVQKELTSHYHWVSLGNYEQMATVCRQAGEPMPAAFMTGLEMMWNYLAYSISPQGYGLLNNDSDRDFNRDRVLSAATTYQRPDWQWIASNGREGEEPAGPPSMVFPWSGQLVMRNGWKEDAQWAFFDIGPFGVGHFHSDKLHLSIAAHGRDLLVDTGRFSYSGKMADSYRLPYAFHSAGHNVILVDGFTQLTAIRTADKPIESYTIQPDFDFAMDRFDQGFVPSWEWTQMYGGKAPPRIVHTTHTRAVLYLRHRFWMVFDHVVPDQPRTITSLWHLHPDCGVRIAAGNAVETVDQNVGNIRITPLGGPDWKVALVEGQMEPGVQGWYSETYGQAVPSPCAVYRAAIDAPTTFAWLMVTGQGDVPQVDAQMLDAPDGVIRLRVTPSGEEPVEVAVRMAGEGPVALSGGHTLEGRCAVLIPGKPPQAALGSIRAQ